MDGNDTAQTKCYGDFFIRPGEYCDTTYYTDKLEATAPQGEKVAVEKFQNLFADCFGHHVAQNLEAPPHLTVQSNDSKRFVTADSITSYFIENLYKVPGIYATANVKINEETNIDYDAFLARICDSPVTTQLNSADSMGSNRISFLVGDIGSGKSLLLSKVTRDILRMRKKLDAQELLVPVYFDFESAMKAEGGRLLDVDEGFFRKLESAIVNQIKHFDDFSHRTPDLDNLACTDSSNYESSIISTIKYIYKCGLRLIIILDNVDGYHYHYDKYTFFQAIHEKQADSIKKNISGLTRVLSEGQHLGLLGMSIVFAARRYVFHDCIHTIEPEANCAYSGSVFQLETVGEEHVVAPRVHLFEQAISEIEKSPQLKPYAKDYREALARIRMLLGLKASARGESPILGNIRRLCHHGNRDLVRFLSGLRLDYRNEPKLIERFFWDKPHTLVLLYIVNSKSRYTQHHGHFPNMFLVDAVILRNSSFSQAHRPHMHTYWLKYLLLSYACAQKNKVAIVTKMRQLFVGKGRYEEELFQLTLGSLCTTKESGCLEPAVGEKTTPSKVKPTERGKAVLAEGRDAVPFCFSFPYLQLVVDDYLMSYPIDYASEVYFADVDLDYLFRDDNTFTKIGKLYLSVKMRSVLAFITLLDVSLKVERGLRPDFFKALDKEAPGSIPNFQAIFVALSNEFRRILDSYGDGKEMYSDLVKYGKKLDMMRAGLEDSLKEYYLSNVRVDQ